MNDDYKKNLLLQTAESAATAFFGGISKQKRLQDAETSRAANELALKQRIEFISQNKKISLAEFQEQVKTKCTQLIQEKKKDQTEVFQLDGDLNLIFRKLTYYFVGRAAEIGLNQNKPIALLGNIGVGKTTLAKALENNPFASYRITTAKAIEADYRNTGDAVFNYDYTAGPENQYGETEYDILIDEVGREPQRSLRKGESFASEGVNVLATLFTVLYEKPNARVHFISNIQDYESFAQIYGYEVADRVWEMYNIITYKPDASSRR